MPQTLKVENVDEALIERLADRAVQHGRSVEAEHRAILAEALGMVSPFEEISAKLRAILDGRKHTPSELLMRESRDER